MKDADTAVRSGLCTREVAARSSALGPGSTMTRSTRGSVTDVSVRLQAGSRCASKPPQTPRMMVNITTNDTE